MRPRTHARPRLHELEGRDVPADLTVTYAAASQTLTMTGTDDPNQLTITADVSDPTHFFLSSTADTFNGTPSPFATPSGVRNIVVKMKAGNDSVTLAATPAIKLAGSLTVDGGDGANSVGATDLTVARNVSIKNGTNAAGTDSTSLTNLNVGGGVTVANGDGASNTLIQRTTAGLSTVGRNVAVTNGTGYDLVLLADLNVGGNVTVRNGQAAPGGNAGTTQLFNQVNATAQSLVRGSVSVSFLDGTASGNGIFDGDVGGNVAFTYGAGGGSTYFDSFRTDRPTAIRGNVTVAGAGALQVLVGIAAERDGAVVGKNFKVTGGAAADALTLNRLVVNGATTLALGDGNNSVVIDDSLFAGAFNLTTGAGTDTVRLDTAAGTSKATTFNKAVKMSLGAGTDAVTFGGNTDAFQAITFAGGCTVKHGAEGELAVRYGKDTYPFGGGLQWLV